MCKKIYAAPWFRCSVQKQLFLRFQVVFRQQKRLHSAGIHCVYRGIPFHLQIPPVRTAGVGQLHGGAVLVGDCGGEYRCIKAAGGKVCVRSLSGGIGAQGRQQAGSSSAGSGKRASFLKKMANSNGLKSNDTTLSIVLKSAALIVVGLIMAVGIYVGIVFTTAPKINTDDIYSMLSQRSVMYDSDGNEIENLYFSDGNRTIVKYDDIPEDMVNAVVSIEDKKFWSHNGFNFIRMVGAIKDSVLGGGQISGTSTVTQQLARNVYLSEIKSQRSLSRKISEAYCTLVLEKNLTKEEIMEA